MAGRHDLHIDQGATFQKICFYKDRNGAPINLSGMSITAQMRSSYSDSEIVEVFSISIPDQNIIGNVGKFTIELTAEQTASIPVQKAFNFETTTTNYSWDLQLNAGSTIKKLLYGSVYVLPEVTR